MSKHAKSFPSIDHYTYRAVIALLESRRKQLMKATLGGIQKEDSEYTAEYKEEIQDDIDNCIGNILEGLEYAKLNSL